MKIQTLLFVLLFYSSTKGQQVATRVELPLTTANGYGPFSVGFSRFTPDVNDGSYWSKMQLSIKGVPKNWTNVEKAMARVNTWQLIYQNVISGTVPRSWYKGYQQSSKINLDDALFSKQPIKCYVYLVKGFDQSKSKWLVLVDTNNNLDFSDETPFEAEEIKPGSIPDNVADARLVMYQSYQKGKIITSRIPLVVKRMGNDLFFNFPQYAKATFRHADERVALVITNGFAGLDYIGSTSIAQTPRWFWQKTVSQKDLTEIGDVITLGGRKYKNKGVNTFTNTLQLEPLATNTIDYSLRTGRSFRPFIAREFTTGNSISLSSLKGKYVFVDFWGTWCSPCVSTLPTLKRLYQRLNKNRFEFIGIVSRDSPEHLRDFLKKHDVRWPQLLSNGPDGLVDQYHVTAYPTSVLLNPNGKIVAADLSMEKLEAKLNELNKLEE
ncbi:TlpA family protein disulfide reductase [Spirosoma sp. RP8]|uniref:TlpA family protein disulfide reductase n=1 Tax=Spirosoma liriopis TaxID=2937440 RepID=A0ABT0HTA8_9BACT|nr:TlpA disulfide reductase family protein [Spirosoma liriopis]MCK8495422.1 TlpA family protein disulfide reductase [Spirosoma liriopis]